ncbi:hypothetical protein PROAA_460032 [Candidatus Propionivibrio aalborgensis]|uniref:Uncharacterized protein n=1 Tax=Candidatus Propionivibrio aalborgensis TaxID=1860101 RepID=A0A1A8Y211_9RHOO|nr:hypothetical protein [Candidatus Propionivibrio aalborgensis]SBT10418.1 hypothetical protein PROAA_460032 [Candidatus Propionivibrio aalborgensis]
MQPVTPKQSLPLRQATGGEHGGHNAAPIAPTTGGSFANTLAQTITQAIPQNGSTAHGDHGGASSQTGLGNSGTGSTQYSGTYGATVGGHPGHNSLKSVGHFEKHALQEAVLGLRSYRQQLIASNLYN